MTAREPPHSPIPRKPANVLNSTHAAVEFDASPRSAARYGPDELIEALPDLVLLLGRDGILLAHGGGRAMPGLKPRPNGLGKGLDVTWPERIVTLIKQLTRKAIAQRDTMITRFSSCGVEYTAQVSPQGPERVLCVIRLLGAAAANDLPETDACSPPELDRRGFLQRFKESLSWATLREKPLALAIIHVDGLADVAQVLASEISEQLMSAAIRRLPPPREDPASTANGPRWYLGQLNEGLLAVVIESADRDAIESCVGAICTSLREPVSIGDAQFHLTPYAGVAILGQDASTPQLLLEQARTAALEARRAGATQGIRCFTDTMKLRALARIDLAGELRDAIANGDIRLRYVGRHELHSGRLVACVGYLRWTHPLRGEIRPAEFLRIAAATGLASALSRAVFTQLRRDFAVLAERCGPEVCISFGALRHHVLDEVFLSDLSRVLGDGGIPAQRLELRVPEKVFVTRAPAHAEALERLGVRLIIDEVGRGIGSLDALARAPISGLQLDRAWVTALRTDSVAGRVCRAGIEMARALGLVPIATGIDDAETRDALVNWGCAYGGGKLYQDDPLNIRPPFAAAGI